MPLSASAKRTGHWGRSSACYPCSKRHGGIYGSRLLHFEGQYLPCTMCNPGCMSYVTGHRSAPLGFVTYFERACRDPVPGAAAEGMLPAIPDWCTLPSDTWQCPSGAHCLLTPLMPTCALQCLFATETFAMGLNMPAKTVIFTAMAKWDGTQVTPMLRLRCHLDDRHCLAYSADASLERKAWHRLPFGRRFLSVADAD